MRQHCLRQITMYSMGSDAPFSPQLQTHPAESRSRPLTKPDCLCRQKPADSIGAALHAVLPAARPRKTALSDNRLRVVQCLILSESSLRVRTMMGYDAADDLDAVYRAAQDPDDVRIVAGSHHDRRFPLKQQSDIYSRGLQGRCDQTRTGTSSSTTRMDGLFMNVHLALRQCKGKDTAIGNVVTQGQCSAVSRQDCTAEGQAQSKAAVAVCDAALPGIKHLEHLCFCAIRNAGTVMQLPLRPDGLSGKPKSE